MVIQEERDPFVDKVIIKYLKRTYDLRSLLADTSNLSNSDAAIGYMLGVQEVINRLEVLATREDD